MKKEHAIIGFVATAVICFVLGYVLGTANTGGDAKQEAIVAKADGAGEAAPEGVAAAGNNGPDSDVIPVGTSAVQGSPNASVTIVEFSEFQCPFCSRVLPTTKQILETYPNEVRVVFKHNPLSFHKEAPLASEASMAAGEQGKFWEYHDILFANQRALTPEDLDKYAQQLGLDMAKFKAALDSGKFKKQIAEDQALANKLGARGTPNFFVNGIKVVGAKPFDEFKTIIDGELSKAKGQGAAGYAARVTENFKKEAPAPRNNRPPADDTTIYKATIGTSAVQGSKDAIVTIVEFSEFQCPFCSRVMPTLKQLDEAYPGQIRVVFKHMPLPFHKEAPMASRATIAAGEQGKFWEYHDVLFANQKALTREDLEKYAQQLGLNMTKFKAGLDNAALDKQIEEDKALGASLGARGTPHFFINGKRLSGAQPYDRFKEAVDEAIKRVAPLTAKGLKGDALYDEIMKTASAEFKAAPAGDAPEADNTVYKIDASNAPTKGPANAKVHIVVFSEFQCPFCSRALPTVDALFKDYDGKIKFSFMHMPLPFHKDAPLAAEASMAADEQGKFWEYHDLLFANQKALTREDLEKYAQQLGLNMTKFKAALDQGTFKKVIEDHMAKARTVGASGTPTFFINGRKLVGAQPPTAFKPIIDEELKK